MMNKMKKFAATMIAALTIGVAAIGVTTPAEAAVPNGYYTTTAGDFLALRTGAGTQFSEIDRLDYGTFVSVEACADDWAYVYVPARNEYGYVYTGYLAPNGNSCSSAAGIVKTCCVKESYLALRTAPAFVYENEIGKIWAGQQVIVQWYTNNGYAYVYAPTLGQYGYVNAGFIC